MSGIEVQRFQHMCSRGSDMLAGMHIAQKYAMAVGWYAQSSETYMLAGMHVVQKYCMAVGWHT